MELVEWSVRTKFDCYSKVFTEKTSLLKFVWLVCFLIFSAATAFCVTRNIHDYYSYEVVSKIEIVNEKPIDFPAITICNANPFTTLSAQDLLNNITTFNYAKDVNTFTSDDIFNNVSFVYEMGRMYASRHEYQTVDKKRLGNELNIPQKYFNNRLLTSRDFAWYFNYFYGNCQQFNADRRIISWKTMTEGPTYGLSLVIAVPLNENNYPALDGDGVKLFVHNRSFVPKITEVINLKTGQEINVAVKRTDIHKTPRPYSECQELDTGFDSTFFRVLRNANRTYRQYDCFKLCLQELINQKCECFYEKYLSVNSSASPCLNLIQLNCIYEQQSAFTIDEDCLTQCPLECDTVSYDTQVTSLVFPSQSLFDSLEKDTKFVTFFSMAYRKNFTLENMRETLISLKIYYPLTQYTSLIESPRIGSFDLFAQIGGSLGMLLGFSIFHLVELLEVLLLIVIAWFKKT